MLRPIEELRFWTAIMRDHGEFMIISFSSREQEYIRMAYYFRNSFAALHEEVKKHLDSPDSMTVMNLANSSQSLLVCFINFKQMILKRLLECNIEINLPPTFINHMINEALEFYRTLCMLQTNMPLNTALEDIRLHTVWLPDAAGHAATIACGLDPVEKMLIKEAEDFEKSFNNMVIKASELEKMLVRTCLDAAALKRFNEEVRTKIEEFICFLDKVLSLREQCKAMGTLKPLMPFHMIREEKHYLEEVKSISCK